VNDLALVRRRYAELIRQAARLRSESVTRALAEVPREDYLGPGPWKILRPPNLWSYETTPSDDPACIYEDVLVALDPVRHLNNGLPSGLAGWIEALDLHRGERILHLGCGTGYYTAVMACIVGQAGRVIALEIDPELAARARKSLGAYPWVEALHGDATFYDPREVDAVLVNAGATHPLALWLDSLRLGGRLVFPLVRWPWISEFVPGKAGWGVMLRIERLEVGYCAKLLSPAGFFPCLGALDEEADRLLADAMVRGGLTEVRSLRREVHDTDPACLLHGRGYCFSSLAPEGC
jgi:protein-L-isoaspartate(D-aspartate) O-methyltransferase